jgi:hypothetical protein
MSGTEMRAAGSAVNMRETRSLAGEVSEAGLKSTTTFCGNLVPHLMVEVVLGISDLVKIIGIKWRISAESVPREYALRKETYRIYKMTPMDQTSTAFE